MMATLTFNELITFGCIDITFLSVLSLEVIFISYGYGNIRNTGKGLRLGWLHGEVIAAYFYCLRQCYKNLEPTDPSEALATCTFGSIWILSFDMNSVDIDYVYLSYKNSDTHWILAAVHIRASAVIILDHISINYEHLNKSHRETVFIVSDILNKGFSFEVIESMTIRHSLKQDKNSCGVYCSFDASQILPGNLNYFSSALLKTLLVWIGV